MTAAIVDQNGSSGGAVNGVVRAQEKDPSASSTTTTTTGEKNDGDGDSVRGRKTHIEVCARLRPLHVSGTESSNGFFLRTAAGAAAASGRIRTPTKRASSAFVDNHRSLPRKPQLPSSTGKNTAGRLIVPNMLFPGRKKDEEEFFYAWDIQSDDTASQSLRTERISGRTHNYTLDKVYGPQSTTADLYGKSVRDLVHAAMDGYHASVLAYGQTSTGKTHTMTGTKSDPGIIPMAVRECFAHLRHSTSQQREYLLRVSYFEIYKEKIRDLLSASKAPPPVRLFDDKGEIVIRGLTESVITSPEQVFSILAQGEARRQVGSTALNLHSSRSHVIVRIWIESRTLDDVVDVDGGTNGNSSKGQRNGDDKNGRGVRISSLSLVDLAGSESVRLTGESSRREEGHFINQSLMTLGKVVYALSEQQDQHQDLPGIGRQQQPLKHIPYRDSKLTRLLQPSLSGNAQVVLICCISPLASHLDESHNTFKFAIRAKKIPQTATINEAQDEKTLLESYRDEIEELKRQLIEARQQQERLLQKTASAAITGTVDDIGSDDLTAAMTDELAGEDGEIQELVKSIQTMEKLILKSKPAGSTPTRAGTLGEGAAAENPEDLLDEADASYYEDDNDDDLLALATNDRGGVATPTRAAPKTPPPPRTPSLRDSEPGQDLEAALSRVKGLLGSVLKKRHAADGVFQSSSGDEVQSLRAQLEQQQAASNLRKADASFLQKQLEEKDSLLREVSKILEALEDRQTQLERENAALRARVAEFEAAAASEQEEPLLTEI